LVHDTEPLLSCFSTAASVDECIVTLGNDSIAVSTTSNRPVSIQRSCESTVLLYTPGLKKTPSPQSLNRSISKHSSGKGSKSFLSQKNNLMTWVTSSPEQQPTDITYTPLPATVLPSPHNVPSLSPCQSESLALDVHSAPNPPISSRIPAPAPAAPHTPAPRPFEPHPSVGPATTANAETSTPAEWTAIKLTKQLQNFQGCTHEQHDEADWLYQEHH
jgi:hypothetical protein